MLFIALLSVISVCHGANILVMVPLSAKSHVYAFKPVFNKLLEKGHNITVVGSQLDWKSETNLTVFDFKDKIEKYIETGLEKIRTDKSDNNPFKDPSKADKHSLLSAVRMMFMMFYEVLWNDQEFIDLINDQTTYDLMISESHYLHELFIVFAHIHKVPTVIIESHFPSAWSCFLTGNICPSFNVPNYKGSNSDRMSFIQGLRNAQLNLVELLENYFYYLPQQEYILRKHLKHPSLEDLPPLLTLLKNVSLILVDSHFSQAYPRPYLPNVVEVGGLTIGANETMDQELLKYMNESTHGVIYFTFGSTIPLEFLPKKLLNAFLDAFKDIKQDVIMKWDEKSEKLNTSSNVKLLNWAPQNSILAHPKCVMFISHAGIHSLTEAIHHGVPLLLIPIFSDQDFNSKFAEVNGFARILDRDKISYQTVLDGIHDVLSNSSYKENVIKRSRIYKDRPLSALDTAVYWIEYVIRHKGAYHLQPSTLNMSIYEYILLDIGLELLLFTILTVILIYLITHVIMRFLRK